VLLLYHAHTEPRRAARITKREKIKNTSIKETPLDE
jgi:hypothetical protein